MKSFKDGNLVRWRLFCLISLKRRPKARSHHYELNANHQVGLFRSADLIRPAFRERRNGHDMFLMAAGLRLRVKIGKSIGE